MTRTGEYEQARRRAESKYGFFVHVGVFVSVMVLLVVIDLLTSPGSVWFIWPLIGWGLAVALHGARVFLLADRNPILDMLTERELRHSGADKEDATL
ncbi:2TM domain-containing protein [Tropicimonas marinistellae]|uniref:2TM domain-containing protein n=1 Tax=Tropicimonas marinistellae TaxID=1739787 RepID=UPI00082B7504|nr:2TM domain-containing protein [Tropicimonas marinistellae]